MQEHYGKHKQEPEWRAARCLRRGELSDSRRGWLLDRSSLTRRLQGACDGEFSVRVLGQGWASPMHSEARALGIPLNQRVWRRQVQLCCDGRPWVFARTLIPLKTLHGPQGRLLHLGSRPLGAVLFADPRMRRGPVEVARLGPGSRLHRAAATGTDELGTIWGRRSLFQLGGSPLLVAEFFLGDPWPSEGA